MNKQAVPKPINPSKVLFEQQKIQLHHRHCCDWLQGLKKNNPIWVEISKACALELYHSYDQDYKLLETIERIVYGCDIVHLSEMHLGMVRSVLNIVNRHRPKNKKQGIWGQWQELVESVK